jgi:hypothetical protein
MRSSEIQVVRSISLVMLNLHSFESLDAVPFIFRNLMMISVSRTFSYFNFEMLMMTLSRLSGARGDHWAKIVEQRAIKNRVQYIHCR